MESPASWKTAELIILDALEEHDGMMAAGVVGASSVHLVATRLREAGLINDSGEPEIGWDKLREHRNRRKHGQAAEAEDGSPLEDRQRG